MNATKFTPGPWRYVNGVQICSTKDPIAKVWMMRNGEGKANAHLIAAAPELYEAVKELLYALQDDENWRTSGVYEDAEAALAKARGEA